MGLECSQWSVITSRGKRRNHTHTHTHTDLIRFCSFFLNLHRNTCVRVVVSLDRTINSSSGGVLFFYCDTIFSYDRLPFLSQVMKDHHQNTPSSQSKSKKQSCASSALKTQQHSTQQKFFEQKLSACKARSSQRRSTRVAVYVCSHSSHHMHFILNALL